MATNAEIETTAATLIPAAIERYDPCPPKRDISHRQHTEPTAAKIAKLAALLPEVAITAAPVVTAINLQNACL